MLHSIVLRLYVEVISPWIVKKKSTLDGGAGKGDNVSSVDGQYRHLVVFENQLRTPVVGAIWKEMDENF
jgi:hypothetical protein